MGFEEKTKKIIDDLRKDIDKTLKNVKASKEEGMEEIEKLIKELKSKGNHLNTEFEDFKKNNQETFDNIEGSLKQVAGDVKKIFKDAFNKFNK